MLIFYRVVWWDEPLLSEAEEIEHGKKIALVGKKPFVDEFLKTAGPKNYQPEVVYTKKQIITSVLMLILIFSVMSVMLYLLGKLKIFSYVLCFVLAIYFVSTAISIVRLNLWLNKLVRRYAIYVAHQNS